MKLIADDPTFTTTSVVTLPPNFKGWMEWLRAHNCRPSVTTSSFGNLKGLVYQSHNIIRPGGVTLFSDTHTLKIQYGYTQIQYMVVANEGNIKRALDLTIVLETCFSVPLVVKNCLGRLFLRFIYY